MTELFGIPIDILTIVLLIITGIIVGGVLLLAIGNRIFFKIGVRNIPRRRTQMILIVFALMLSTTLLSSVLTTGDVMNSAVKSVAVYNLGNIDELIEGGRGTIGLYPDDVYYNVARKARQEPDSNIAAVGAALREQGLLVADETSRQVRSQVTALGVVPGSESGFGGMQNIASKKQMTIAALRPDEAYLNQTLAQLLNAKAGDTLYLYSQRWQGQRYVMHVVAIVNNAGLVGDNPSLLAKPDTFRRIEHDPDGISQIFIANRGVGTLNGLALSESVTSTLNNRLFRGVHVIEVKQQGVQVSQSAEDIFSRVFALFTLFALAIGLLLIFLIFVLLAAERRAEMGMARAIGVLRRHLVLMYLFEGTVYDLISSLIGLLIGLGIGSILFFILNPILERFDFPLKLVIQPRSMVIAYCLGVIFTFCSVGISAWIVSRMTVVDALRNLPESDRPSASLAEILAHFFDLLRSAGTMRNVRRILFEQLPDTFIGLIHTLTRLGILPLIAGYWLIHLGLKRAQIMPFSFGLSLLVIGVGLLIKSVVDWVLFKLGMSKWKRVVQGIFAAVVGLTILAYWALPFDALAILGLPRFQGGVEVFFVAGLMMVLGVVWALMANAELLIGPLQMLSSRLPGMQLITRLASAYPLHHRFRTGLSVVMFSMVVFVMTVMAIITNAMQNNYTDINFQTGGYDIQAVAYFKPILDIRSALVSHGIDPNAFAAIGTQTSTAVGVIQPNADAPAWHIYPAQVVSGGFLQGYGLHLAARAQGFDNDNAVWQALQSHPNYALIDNTALPYRPFSLVNSPVYDPNAPSPAAAGSPIYPPGFDPYFTYSMNGVYQGDTSFTPTPIWVAGFQQRSALKLTIIGVVDNSDSAHFGLYISQKAYSNFQTDPSTPEAETYYFKVAPGEDKRALALSLGSAFLDNGLETTVLEDAIWTLRGPRILLSNVLLGVVGLTLLLGVAALAITGTRAVVERRQQIGMLRALGSKRRLLQGAFLCESFFIGCIGSLIGVTLGLILSRNIFAVNFFEQFHTGLTFTIPWEVLGLLVGIALLASLIAALLPAWQAGRVAPSEALRS